MSPHSLFTPDDVRTPEQTSAYSNDREQPGAAWRLAVTAGAVVFVCAAIIALTSRSYVSETLVERARMQAVATTQTFASVHANAILTADIARLAASMRTIVDTEPWLLYVNVVGADGDVLAGLPVNSPPEIQKMIVSTPILQGPYVTRMATAGQRIYDFAVPVVPGIVSRVHIGVREEDLQGPIRSIDLVLGGMAMIVALTGSMIAWALGRRLGGPTERLIEAARALGLGHLDRPIPTQTGDPHLDRIAKALDHLRADLVHQRLQTGREALRAASAEKLAALGTLIAGIAHQVNNPLAGMLSSIEMARRSTLSAEDRDMFLDLAKEATVRLAALMRRLTDYAHTKPLQSTKVDVNEIVRHAVQFGQTWDRKDDPPPVMMLTDEPLWVLGEFDALSDVVLNLYSNARLSAPGKPLHITTEMDGNWVLLRVRDFGPGVPPEWRQRIFEPFFTTREPGKGTGMGLALSDSIVRRHAGNITVDDEVDPGAQFVVKLPAWMDRNPIHGGDLPRKG